MKFMAPDWLAPSMWFLAFVACAFVVERINKVFDRAAKMLGKKGNLELHIFTLRVKRDR